jgi:integrase
MRPGELRALTWADVDLERGIVTVRRTISRGADGSEVIANRTKTNQVRTIAIDAATVERLRWHKARQNERRLRSESWRPSGVVFDGGSGHFLYQGPWQRWHRLMCARVGVPVIRCHDLSHTAATLMVRAGLHPKMVAEILGHANIHHDGLVYALGDRRSAAGAHGDGASVRAGGVKGRI